MTYINEIVGFTLLALGVITVIICLLAFVKVVFAKENKKGVKEVLAEINALLKVWLEILKILPESVRHIFLLLLFGMTFIVAGILILAYKPL